MEKRSLIRVAVLLLGLPLAACQTTDEPLPAAGTDASPFVAAAPTAAAAPVASAAASPPPTRSAGSGGGPRGGASTAAARPEPEETETDPLTQARTDCWMAVEHKKGMRGIDQRGAYVDKCVAIVMKGGKPPP